MGGGKSEPDSTGHLEIKKGPVNSSKRAGAGNLRGPVPRSVESLDAGACRAKGEDFKLSDEERQIVFLAAAGFTIRSIARRLLLTESTVRRLIAGVCRKLGVTNQIELVFWAIDRGISQARNDAPQSASRPRGLPHAIQWPTGKGRH